MKKLTRLQVLLLILGLPTILRLVTLPFDNLILFGLITLLTFGLLSTWYFDVLKTIKDKVEIEKSKELTIKSYLIYLLIYPVFASIIQKNSPTEISTILVFGHISFSIFGFISFYFLAESLDAYLVRQNEKSDKVMTFIFLVVYPIGIWKYHDKLKEDWKASA